MRNVVFKKERSSLMAFCAIGIVFGILNATTVHSSILSAMVTIVEYIIVLALMLKKNYIKSFFYFLLFTCIVIEQDGFILGDVSQTEMLRYHFFRAPIFSTYLFFLLPIIFYCAIRKKGKEHSLEKDVLAFRKWLCFLAATGLFAIFVGMLQDDNGILSSGNYPKKAITDFLPFLGLFLVFLTSIELTKEKGGWHQMAGYSQAILIVVVISVIISTFVFGVQGWYSVYPIMLTPISIALTPFLILFVTRKSGGDFKVASLVVSILVIISSFIYPTCIGSKWYIVIFMALFGCILLTVRVKSIGIVIFISIALVTIVITNSELILGLFGNDYVTYKLSQTLKLFNLFDSSSSLSDSYAMLDNSTLYRFDEPANIFIEYKNKPLYALFGKGFGGTTLHYTNLLSWETDSGSFSDAEIKMHAFSNMHETLSVVFLRHGLLGLVFMVYVIVMLVRRLMITPWAMIALVWFMFYWSYGMSSIVGAVALILALSVPHIIDKNINSIDAV